MDFNKLCILLLNALKEAKQIKVENQGIIELRFLPPAKYLLSFSFDNTMAMKNTIAYLWQLLLITCNTKKEEGLLYSH